MVQGFGLTWAAPTKINCEATASRGQVHWRPVPANPSLLATDGICFNKEACGIERCPPERRGARRDE